MMDEILQVALSRIGCEFKSNELAYLAATSKVEGPFRDRLAFFLHREHRDWTVCREWRRIDLAILNDGEPLGLIELKACHTSGMLVNGAGWIGHVRTDLDGAAGKARLPAGHRVPIYGLLLLTHLDRQVPIEFHPAVKYWREINLYIENWTAEDVKRRAINSAEESFLGEGWQIAVRGQVDGGQVYGIGVSVIYWLVRVA
jgi:hypothetical protein